MTNYSKQLEKYKSVDVHSRTETANPHELIELLLQGAQTNIIKAIGSTQQNNIQAKTASINKTISIIDGLMNSLDHEKGGEVAANLLTFYQSILKLLISANLKNDIALLRRVNELIGEILAAWRAIKPQNGTEH